MIRKTNDVMTTGMNRQDVGDQVKLEYDFV